MDFLSPFSQGLRPQLQGLAYVQGYGMNAFTMMKTRSNNCNHADECFDAALLKKNKDPLWYNYTSIICHASTRHDTN
jgi:hypothetical protein